MISSLLLIFSFLFTYGVGVKTAEGVETRNKVVVLDTGYGFKRKGLKDNLCLKGHKDFSKEKSIKVKGIKDRIPLDYHGHGTNVAGLIEKYAGKTNYCLIIVKYDYSGVNAVPSYLKALKYSTEVNAKLINISGGGRYADDSETRYIKNYLDSGGIVVAAAGNNATKLGTHSKFFPAMSDERVISVGSLSPKLGISSFSNSGPHVKVWEQGERQEVYGITLSGTSQAAAIHTGKLIRRMHNEK
jgi:subtilisin family serine protease